MAHAQLIRSVIARVLGGGGGGEIVTSPCGRTTFDAEENFLFRSNVQ